MSGVFAIGITIWEYALKKTIPFKVYFWVALIALAISSFLAWREQYKKVQVYESERPNFTIDQARMVQFNPGDPKLRMVVGVKNIGKHSANRFQNRLIIINKNLIQEPIILIDGRRANDIPPEESRSCWRDMTMLSADEAPFYIIYTINYFDADSNKEPFSQTWYFTWDGIRGGKFDYTDFLEITPSEVVPINSKISSYLKF